MNSPLAVGVAAAVVGVVLIVFVVVGEICASITADRLAAIIDDDPLYDQDDSLEQSPCDDPGSHSLTGCPRCIEVIVACCRFAFNESLANLWRKAEEQR